MAKSFDMYVSYVVQRRERHKIIGCEMAKRMVNERSEAAMRKAKVKNKAMLREKYLHICQHPA